MRHVGNKKLIYIDPDTTIYTYMESIDEFGIQSTVVGAVLCANPGSYMVEEIDSERGTYYRKTYSTPRYHNDGTQFNVWAVWKRDINVVRELP